MNDRGLSYAERIAAENRCLPLGEVLDLIERVPCRIHGKQREPCEPRACLARAESAGLSNLITGREFALIASQQ